MKLQSAASPCHRGLQRCPPPGHPKCLGNVCNAFCQGLHLRRAQGHPQGRWFWGHAVLEDIFQLLLLLAGSSGGRMPPWGRMLRDPKATCQGGADSLGPMEGETACGGLSSSRGPG